MTCRDLEEFSRYVAAYEAILVHLPWLEDALRARSLDSNDFTKIADKITTGMSEQRSMDLSTVKHAGLAYVPFNMDGKFVFDPPIPKTEDKSNQGFNHPQLARLLCPRKKVEMFDRNPDAMMAGLQDGSIPATTFNWPTFFYEDGVYDPEDRLKGLFRGHIAWRFYVHLFIGPSAASNGRVTSNTSKKSKNRAWNLLRVTPHIIAYVHIIAYLTLSSAPKWANEFGDVDLQAMSWTIVEMFEHSDDWTHETLEWWNTRAFPQRLRNGTASKNKERVRPDPESDDDVLQIRARRAKQASRNPPTSNMSTQICVPASSSSRDSDISENTNDSIASVNRPVIHSNGQHQPERDVSPLTSDEDEDMGDEAPPPVRKTVPANKRCAASLLTNGNEDPEALAPAHKKAAPVNKRRKKPVEQEDIFTDAVDSPGTKTRNAMAHARNQPRVGRPPKKQKNGF